LPISTATPSFLTFVAENVRRFRLAAGLTQAALAEKSGISIRMVGAVENGSTSISTATLDRIGMALNATLADLVLDSSRSRPDNINRIGWIGEHGGHGTLKTSVEARREVETWEWILEPGDRYEAGADPEGWHTQIVVVRGRLTLELPDIPVEIESDAYLFESTCAHAFLNKTDAPVRFFRSTIW
jgi:transcriptional regulator with XRE-family HTH domain